MYWPATQSHHLGGWNWNGNSSGNLHEQSAMARERGCGLETGLWDIPSEEGPSRAGVTPKGAEGLPAGPTLRGSQSRNEARKLKIPEMSHMRATLELKPTPIHAETPKQRRRRARLTPWARYEHQNGSRRFRRA